MGSTGLINMSDLGSHKIGDGVRVEGAYTTMSGFRFAEDLHHASSRDATTGSQDGLMNGLCVLDFARSEACGGWRQRRACWGRGGNGERIMLTTKFVSRKLSGNCGRSFHLRYFAILAANCIILMSGSNTDLEAACNDFLDIFCYIGRERGQVGRRSVMMRQIPQRLRTA